jgi:hypothetical protein
MTGSIIREGAKMLGTEVLKGAALETGKKGVEYFTETSSEAPSQQRQASPLPPSAPSPVIIVR